MFMKEALLRLLDVLPTPGDAGSVPAKQDLLAIVLSITGVGTDCFIVEPGSKYDVGCCSRS